MYIPNYAANTDQKFLKDFIQEYNFGTLVSTSQSGIEANHYPFLLTEENGDSVLWTHLARSNPQWKNLDSTNCLIIFTGPHGYISPVHYINKLNVPTWNYTAVHAKCTSEIVTDENIAKNMMKKLVSFQEAKNGTNWDYNLPEEFHEKLFKSIVWIKLKVVSLEGKFKLSQNRDKTDYKNLVEKLEDNELLKYMSLTDPYK